MNRRAFLKCTGTLAALAVIPSQAISAPNLLGANFSEEIMFHDRLFGWLYTIRARIYCNDYYFCYLCESDPTKDQKMLAELRRMAGLSIKRRANELVSQSRKVA